jgi:hypothetical protein
VQTGTTQQFSAIGYDQNGTAMSPQPSFTWAVGGGGTIDGSGLFTATTAGGPYTVTASSGSVHGTASVTVTAAQVLTSISVSPASASVPTGTSRQFSATAYDQSAQPMSPQPTFTWSANGAGTIDANGLFTAGPTAGPATVTASAQGANGTVSGDASVTVTAVPVLTSISVSPASASVQTGTTQQFSAIGYDQNGTAMSPQPSFTWAVGGGGTIDGSGLFTATTAGGPYTVTASSGSVHGTASVTVTAAPDFSLSVSPSSVSVKRGSTATYTVTVTAINGFSGSVSLSLSGQPSGSTVTFSPSSTTSTSTLRVGTSRSGPRGTFTLTITGTSEGLARTATAKLRTR